MADNDFEIIKRGNPYLMGATKDSEGINLTVAVKPGRSLTLNIYQKDNKKCLVKLPISDDYRTGDLFSFVLSVDDPDKYVYNYYDGVSVFTDPYARCVYGCDKWGVHRPYGGFLGKSDIAFDWGNEKSPKLALEDLVLYSFHVRGFTKHSSSKVTYPGCFEGVAQKIPYLKSLGINQVMLMPSYEFDEVIKSSVTNEDLSNKVNYWGFSDTSLYFAPKSAYSGIGDASVSMKELVKRLHLEGIEICLQFYFPKDYDSQFIVSCLKHWVMEYHIDAFAVFGDDIPADDILKDPFLSDTKIYMWNINEDLIAMNAGCPVRRNRALLQDGFMYDMRRFLKSDEDMLNSFSSHLISNFASHGIINFISNYYGFTLNDLVSYDRKHNEDNGEDNKDGSDYNFSWNCGVEGASRKKSVVSLRGRQIRNALMFLYTSAGIPMLMAGDEFGNSQKGNNNAYCQDNSVTWIDWRLLDKNRELFEFVREIISFRSNSTVFRDDRPKRLVDVCGCGYPDLSFHGEQAWYPQFENYNRHIACLFAPKEKNKDELIFVIYNMYWTPKKFALPKPAKGFVWALKADTVSGFETETRVLSDQEYYTVPERSCALIVCKKDESNRTL